MTALNELPLNYGAGNRSPGINQLPEHTRSDVRNDSALIVVSACQSAMKDMPIARMDDECVIDVGSGGYWEVCLPSVVVRIRTASPYAEQNAQWALEEAGLFLLAASREAATRKAAR